MTPLRISGRRKWLGLGLIRAIVYGAALGVVTFVLLAVFQARKPFTQMVVTAAVFFVLARMTVLVGRRFRAFVQRRLRWQLTMSHLAVILLTFVSITSVGTLIGVAVAYASLAPKPTSMAESTAGVLHPVVRHGAIDRSAAKTLIDEILNRRVIVTGEFPFAIFGANPGGPSSIVVVDNTGLVIASGINHDLPKACPQRLTASMAPSRIARLLAGTRTRPLIELSVHCPHVRSSNGIGPQGEAIAAAPIFDSAHHRVGFVAIEATRYAISLSRLWLGAVAIFSFATVILVVAASIPILAISGFFGYILARGFTKRLESVSQVTSAIGAGDLSRRAPVDSRNEIGRLAQDVNSMAGHLETTMTELTHARTKAESALRARQELVAAISHELRTPLAVLQAQLEAVDLAEHAATGARDTSGSLPDSRLRADTLEVLRGQTAQLTALVDDLFALAQAETRTLTVRHDPVDVSHVVEGVVSSMRPLARRERAITLVAETVPGLPMASGDTERLEQILSNLIRNAVRHTPDGGIIAVSTGMESDHILISVADTGEGIADDHLPHIFEPFYRADSARSRETGGAGLGLAIVRELVELMGGSITVESKRGEGSRFKVILPPNPA